MTPEQAAALRKPFPPESIGKLPRAGVMLAYCGHAAVTSRLLEVDPEWNWEPVASAHDGTPLWAINGNDAVMWIRLTVCGVTRLGVGTAKASAFELEKQLISDALRNAAMRFGVALDLWAKEELPGSQASGADRQTGADGQTSSSAPVSANQRDHLNARAAALVADKRPVADTRMARGLPPINKSNAEQLAQWDHLLTGLEAQLEESQPATPIALADVKNMSNISVIQALKARGLSVEGSRDDLKVRLIGALEQEAPFAKEEIF